MQNAIKKCVACNKEFIDGSRSQTKMTCSIDCRKNLWMKDNHTGQKLRLRFNNMVNNGVTLNDNEKEEIMDKLNNGVCDCCHKKTSFRQLCIDHDHTTNKYRGVICHHCNILLGYLEQNRDIIPLAEIYLTSQT